MYTNIQDFEWDDEKAILNILKHGVTFKEATTVFHDFDALIEEDAEHSIHERRQWAIGLSAKGLTLVIVFTIRPGPLTRIISARMANRKERETYEKNKRF
jgi:uncharacterized DUF497 family protein